MTRHFSLRFTLFLIISDLALVIMALFFNGWLWQLFPPGMRIESLKSYPSLPVYVMAVLLWAAIFNLLNVYDPRNALRIRNELPALTAATGIAWLTLSGFLFFTYRDFSRLEMLTFGVLYLIGVYAHRLLLRGIFRLQGGRRFEIRPVFIVGTDRTAEEIRQKIDQFVWLGLQFSGYVSLEPSANGGSLPVVGSIGDVLSLVASHESSEVIIATDMQSNPAVYQLVQNLQALPVNIRLVPDFFDYAFAQLRIEDLDGLPLLTLKEPVLDSFQRFTKRLFDLIVTPLLLIPSLPLMGLIALLVKLDSRGPVIFTQERLGEGGLVFRMLKFRSMQHNAEQAEESMRASKTLEETAHKRVEDPRVTRIGRFLRKSSLDELPQLFNVLRGEMSLVGPRPELPWLAEKYHPWQQKRFEVPQGITGWWQINGRADHPMHLHTDEDLFYIRNYSLWLDITILWRTIGVVLSGRGAF